jgi:hypothetical protein
LIPRIRNDITIVCSQFTARTAVEVSATTQNLVAEIISAIVEDPHPSWARALPPNTSPDDFANQYLRRTPEMLEQLRGTLKDRKRITAFDFLHWFSTNLSFICPIPK